MGSCQSSQAGTDGLSPDIVSEFCSFCQWAYEVWVNHLELFDNNQRLAESRNSYVKKELNRLSIISQEYGLLQIIKLHDEADKYANTTFGIDYMVKYGGWSGSVRERLDELTKELNSFASPLRGVRNKILSHHDLPTILAGEPLGRFAEGDDDKYFKVLQEFVNVVHTEVIGVPFPFCDHVKNDVAGFLARIDWT